MFTMMSGKKFAVVAHAFGRPYVWVFDNDADASEYFRKAFEFYHKRGIKAAWQLIEIEDPEDFDNMNPSDRDVVVR